MCVCVCVLENVRIRSYSGPYFPAFELNTERYSVSLRIQSEWGKIRTRTTPNTDTFYAVKTIESISLDKGCMSQNSEDVLELF